MQATVQRRRRLKADTIAGYVFIAPAIAGFLLFVVYPLAFSAYTAFTEWNGISAPTWIGFDNFIYMATRDPAFWPSVGATFLFGALSVPTTIVSGLLLALLLNRSLPGIGVFRTLFYLPAVLPVVATLTLWKFIFMPRVGVANYLLGLFGLPQSLWLGGETSAVPTLVVIGTWGAVGGIMIIFLGALQAVSPELYEAAQLDGAGRLSMFLRITLPMISPIIFLQLVLQLIGALQAFTQVHVLTGGGPNNATNFLMYKIYTNGFGSLSSYADLGYATAQVWILFFIIVAITALTFRLSSMWVYEDNA